MKKRIIIYCIFSFPWPKISTACHDSRTKVEGIDFLDNLLKRLLHLAIDPIFIVQHSFCDTYSYVSASLCYYPYRQLEARWEKQRLWQIEVICKTTRRKAWNDTKSLSVSLQTITTVLHFLIDQFCTISCLHVLLTNIVEYVLKRKTAAVESFLPSKMGDEEEPVYRICFLEAPGILDFMNKDKSIDGQVTTDRPIITGSTEKTFNLLMDIVLGRHSINYTTIQSESIGGIAKDGTMTGCYRSMYDNETDFSLTVMDYPIHDFKRLDLVQVYFEEPTKIFSIYHVEPKASVVYNDILVASLSSCFNINTWIMIFTAFIVLSVLLWLRGVLVSKIEGLHKRMFGKRRGNRVKHKDPEPESWFQAVYETFCHLIRQETRNFDDFAGSLISVTMTVGFFFILTIFLNLMSTDLVVTTKPKTIENYEDIINSDPPVIPVFNGQFGDTKEFEKADEESIRGTFWKKYKDTHIAVDPYNDFQGLLQQLNETFQGSKVHIMAGLFAYGARRTLCSMKESLLPQQSNAYSWMSQDPTAEKQQKGIVVRNGMKRTKFVRGLYLRVRHALEAGFRDVMKDDMKEAKLDFGMDTNASIIRECLSDVLKTNEFQVEQAVLPNFKSLFYICLVMITLAFAQLFRELQYHTKTAQYLMTRIRLILDYCLNK